MVELTNNIDCIEYSIPIVTDIHFRHTSPARRLDSDYFETQLGEFEYVVAQVVGGYIFCCGDVFDFPNASPRVMSGIINTLKQYDVHMITTIGQHDVYGHNIAGYKKNTSLGVLEVSGVCTAIHAGEYVDIGNIRVYGYGFGELETRDLLEGRTIPSAPSNMVKVGLIHASVGGEDATIWDSIKDQNIKGLDYAFFGDIHKGFDPYKLPSGTIALSTGALARSNISDIDRAIKYSLINQNKDGSVQLITDGLYIPSIPGKDLFDTNYIEEKAALQAMDFKVALEAASNITNETPEELVFRIGGVMGMNKDIMLLVLRYMGG